MSGFSSDKLFLFCRATCKDSMSDGLSRTLPNLARKPRILVCAPSNAATDELLQRIMDHGFLDFQVTSSILAKNSPTPTPTPTPSPTPCPYSYNPTPTPIPTPTPATPHFVHVTCLHCQPSPLFTRLLNLCGSCSL